MKLEVIINGIVDVGDYSPTMRSQYIVDSAENRLVRVSSDEDSLSAVEEVCLRFLPSDNETTTAIISSSKYLYKVVEGPLDYKGLYRFHLGNYHSTSFKEDQETIRLVRPSGDPLMELEVLKSVYQFGSLTPENSGKRVDLESVLRKGLRCFKGELNDTKLIDYLATLEDHKESYDFLDSFADKLSVPLEDLVMTGSWRIVQEDLKN